MENNWSMKTFKEYKRWRNLYFNNFPLAFIYIYMHKYYFYKRIFELFHILVFLNNTAHFWIRKENISHNKEITWLWTPTRLQWRYVKSFYFTLTLTKTSLPVVIYLMWIFQAKQLGKLRFNLFWPLISYKHMLIASRLEISVLLI